MGSYKGHSNENRKIRIKIVNMNHT